MAVIYLKHEKHGAKVATSDLEAAYDEKNGWKRFDPENAEVQDDDNEPLNAMPKRGRPRKDAQ